MKKLISLFMILSLLVVFAGCRKLHQAEEYLDHKLDVAEEQVEQAVQEAISPTVSPEIVSSSEGITEAEAQAIALEHAGLTEADISRLEVRKDFDDGRKEYDVEFHVDRLEYEYEIDAATGKILSFDKDL